MSKKVKKAKKNDDFLAKEAEEAIATGDNNYTLDIPEDEIWTYRIDGLQEPHIGKPYKNAKRNKVIIVIVLLIAILTSIFLSVRAVHNDLYKYSELPDGTYKLERFANPGSIEDITIDYVVDLETGEKDYSKPITVIGEYAFNCDEVLHSISFGKDVKEISGKSIYSCWWVQNVNIDPDNQYYCDLDGVIYTKDMKTVVFYPNDHDKYLRAQKGYDKLVDDNGEPMEELWGTTKKYNEAFYQKYNRETRTYVIPSTVTTIGELAFAYSNIVDLYIPEGVTRMENMAIFKNTVLTNIYTYKTDTEITDTTYKAMDSMTEIYASLPEGLEFIGSDCMYYLRGLSYMYIPSSVTHIGHHALWDAVYKEDKELRGVAEISLGASEEEFKEKCETGNQWRPQYDYMLFKKSVDLNYSAERESQYLYNVHRQYYWAVQWIINNTSDTVKAESSYLVKDMDGDGTPELVLRQYDETAKSAVDTVLTFKYGYLEDYEGTADYKNDAFSALQDNAMLDSIMA